MSPLLTTPQARKLIAFLAVFGAATLIAFSLFYALSSAPVSAAASIYVSPSGNNTDGSSWTNAYTNVQDALTAATLGDEIWVAAGEYIPTSRRVATDTRSATFELVNGVELYGGFVGTETLRTERDPSANITVLSGDIDENDTTDSNGVLDDPDSRSGNNAYHVVAVQGLVATNTRLDGFVITGGHAEEDVSADGQFDCLNDGCGGAIRIFESELILANMVFRGNESGSLGGAIYNAQNSKITIQNSQFIANWTFSEGGALKNTFSEALIVNTIFVGSRGNNGGAMRNFDSDITIINSTFAGNWSTDGAAIQQTSRSNTILSNTIAYANSPAENNLVNEDEDSTFTVAYSLISETAPYTGTGNITATMSPFIEDPTWGPDEEWATADDTYGNVRLVSTSAARDAGSNALLPLDITDIDTDGNTAETLPVDLDHLNRVNRQTVDMGAYEYSSAEIYLIDSGMDTSVTENGASDTYSVVLSIPTQENVTVTIVTDPEVSLDKSTLVFTPSNWDTPQPIIVTAVNDQIQEVTKTVNLTHTATTTDTTYLSVPTALKAVEVIDDDAAGVTATASGGTTQVFEGGATDSFTIELDTVPSEPVTVTLSTDSDITASITETVFNSGNWDTAVTITVTAVDDSEAEGGEISSVTFSAVSEDTFYNGLSISPESVAVVDNDALVLTPGTTPEIAAEGGTVFTYTLELASAPTNGVTVNIANPDSGQLDLSESSINFSTGDWNVPQVITVTADDDAVPELQEILTITNTTTSSDVNYTSSVATVDVTVNDDDTPAVNVNLTGGGNAVTEGGATDTIGLNLATLPTGSVTVTLSTSADLSLSTTQLVFTTGNFSDTQSVTVTAVDDNSIEGTETPSVTFSAVSTDGDYNGISIGSQSVTITDNDTATVTSVGISPTITLSLSAITDTYTIVLDSQPTADVVITPTGGDGISTSPASLTFTNANWDQPQTITVTMDQTAENGNTSVSYSVSSSDSNFNNISIPNVTIAIDAKKSYFPMVRIAP